MAYHLEVNVKARVSFNFVPILLDQLEDYAAQFKTRDIKDPLLQMLAEPHLEGISPEYCQLIIESCFKSHHEKMLSPYAEYQRLSRPDPATEQSRRKQFVEQYGDWIDEQNRFFDQHGIWSANLTVW